MANHGSLSAHHAGPDAPSPWLWGRTLDLTVGCAAWTIPWLVLTFWLSHHTQLNLGLVFALLALVCNHPHYMATLVRAFGSRDSLAAYRFYTVHLTALLGVALVAAHVYPSLIAPAVTLYVTWSPWHYTGQNFGLFLLFARRAGVPASTADRRLLLFGFAASYAVWLLTLHSQPSADPYLWITSFFARREGHAPRSWRWWPYAAVLVLGGVALFIPGPWVASTVLGFDWRDSALIFIALVNLHHFVLDGAIWKLRDRRVAAVLVGSARVAARAGALRAPLHPALRWGLAGALVASAFVSVLQQFLTLEGAGNAQLDVAQRLNGHDSRVAVRRAELLARAHHPEEALRVLDGVIAFAPTHAPAQRLYGSLLLATGRFEDAATHYRVVEDSVGLDAPGLVNAGMLWAQRGDLEAAAAVLTRAVRLDPGLAPAHLNLAGVLLQRGAAAAALRHYGVFLASPAVARDRTYVAAGLNAASAALQLRTPDDARALLRESSALAERLAATDLVALAAQYAEQIDRLTRRAN